jgi:hypothetical protein
MNIPFVSTIDLVLQITHPKTYILGGSPKLRNTYFVMGQLKRLVTEILKNKIKFHLHIS